ncbi:MAG: hypothetical protein ACRC46_07285 [Thermoguttaceae bacterium]
MNTMLHDLANFGLPPREITLTLRNALLLGVEHAAWLGPPFCIIGLLATMVSVSNITPDGTIPRKWQPAGEATIVSVEKTNACRRTSPFGKSHRIYAYHFRGDAKGTSYGFEGVYKSGDVVPLERSRDKYRLEKLYLTSGGAGSLLFFLVFGINGGLFATSGLMTTVRAFISGRRTVQLLRYGETTFARQTKVQKTSFQLNDRFVYKAMLCYEVDGEEYATYASSLDAEKLTAETHIVFYDRNSPSCAIALSGLPPIMIENNERRDGAVCLTTTWSHAAPATIAILLVAVAVVVFAVVVVCSLAGLA